jgi:signal transduction histidine kinase
MMSVSEGNSHTLPVDQLRRELARRQQFIMMVAHEMRNLLAPVAYAVEALVRVDTATSIRLQLTIVRQVAQMKRLVDDLLDLAASEQGCLSLCTGSLDLREVILGAIDVAQPAIEAREHHLTLAPNPPVTAIIEGDQGRLTQVLSNLLINAAKFTPIGGDICIAVEQEAPCVKVCVRDTGIGIDTDSLPRIFDAYVHTLRAPDGSRSGLGLGLAVARLLVESHGGTLCAHSAGPGKGSEFVMSLPRQRNQCL